MSKAKAQPSQQALAKAEAALSKLEKQYSELRDESEPDVEATKRRYKKADAKLAGLRADIAIARCKSAKRELRKMLAQALQAEANAQRKAKKARKAIQEAQTVTEAVKSTEAKYMRFKEIAEQAKKIAVKKQALLQTDEENKQNAVRPRKVHDQGSATRSQPGNRRPTPLHSRGSTNP